MSAPAMVHEVRYNTTEYDVFDGEKYPGGMGYAKDFYTDYYMLRAYSEQLFKENVYARGLLDRIVTNEINTGLMPEATPLRQVLNMTEDQAHDWTEQVETLYSVWADDAGLCDRAEQMIFGAQQRAARLDAAIVGDVLVVLHQSKKTNLPQVQLVKGDRVRTPFPHPPLPQGHTITHGVQLDPRGRHVAYHGVNPDGTSFRVPAWGEKSKRRKAWLYYGSQMRIAGVRGMPLLSILIQSLKELDRYRDAATRKAVVAALLALYVKREKDGPAVSALLGGASSAESEETYKDTKSGAMKVRPVGHGLPGVVLDNIGAGSEVKTLGGDGTDVNFPKFEEALTAAMAWSNGIPPEIYRLSFSSNYSASQAAVLEYRAKIAVAWQVSGSTFCHPIYKEWLLSEVLQGNIDAPGLVDSFRDARRYAEFGAWTAAEWFGAVKPSSDPVKQLRAAREAIAEGLLTRAQAARMLYGTKYSATVERLRRENEQLVTAREPLLDLDPVVSQQQNEELMGDILDRMEAIEEDVNA